MKKILLLYFLFVTTLLSSCAVCFNPDGQCKWEKERDWNKAFELNKIKANEGNALEQRHLAIRMLMKTDSESEDYINKTHSLEKGIEFLEKSSNKGDALSQYLLGKALVTGVASRSSFGFWPESKDESIPRNEIKRDFDRGIDLLAKASQSRCYAYGNKTHEINFEIGKFYGYASYEKVNTYKNDAWRLRHFLYCSNQKTYSPATSFAPDERGRFSGIMAAVDYFRNGKSGPLKMDDINESLQNLNVEKLNQAAQKYQETGWSMKQISNYAVKLIFETNKLNQAYPLFQNFVINPVWD